MKLQEIADALGCEVLTPIDNSVEIEDVAAADGMSEILAFARPGALMVTGLTNIQSVRTALVADSRAILYVRGKRPPEAVLQLARQTGIPVLVTRLGMFESCGVLYAAGLRAAM
jgi:predicted transcriptional regulator